VHLVNVEPKVGRGEKVKPMDNLCEGVKNNEENTMVWSYLKMRAWWPSGTMLK